MSEPSSHNQSRSRRPRPGRLGVGIVSAGRVGAVLGSALRAVDHRVVGVHAVSEASRERAEMLLPGVPVLEVEEVVRRAELVLLAVPDDELAGLVGGLADVGAWRAGQLVVHTSGRYGADVVFETAGAVATVELGLAVVKRHGRILVVGTVPGEAPVSFLKINREVTIQTVFRSCNSCPTTIALMRSGALDVSSLVDRHFDYADVQKAFEVAAGEPEEFTKAVVVVDADLT